MIPNGRAAGRAGPAGPARHGTGPERVSSVEFKGSELRGCDAGAGRRRRGDTRAAAGPGSHAGAGPE